MAGDRGSPESRGPPEDPGRGPPGDPGREPPARDRTGNETNGSENGTAAPPPSLGPEATALDYQLAAIDAVRTADAGPGEGGGARRFLARLNGTLAAVVDPDRVESADVFRTDGQVVAPLRRRAPNATHYLVESDAMLAATAIEDAERVVATLEARNRSYPVAAVTGFIREAKAAFERAERMRARSPPAAVQGYRQAWTEAQRALDAMDWAVEPTVTVTTRTDLPHDGNVTYRVAGRVFDVRLFETGSVTLDVNGEPRTVGLAANTTPGTVGTVATNVTLDPQVNRIRVSTTDPNRTWAPADEDEVLPHAKRPDTHRYRP